MIKLVSPDNAYLIQQIISLETEAFGDAGMDEWGLMPLIRHGKVFIMEENDQVIGCIQYMRDWDDPSKSYIVGISISAAHRGKGFGTQLMGTTMDLLVRDGFTVFELTVDPDNTAGIAVYERKLGFRTTGRRVNEYGKGLDRIVMEKKMG